MDRFFAHLDRAFFRASVLVLGALFLYTFITSLDGTFTGFLWVVWGLTISAAALFAVSAVIVGFLHWLFR